MDCRLNKKAYGKPAPCQVQTVDAPLRSFLCFLLIFFSLTFLLTQLDIVAVTWQGEEIEMSCLIRSLKCGMLKKLG